MVGDCTTPEEPPNGVHRGEVIKANLPDRGSSNRTDRFCQSAPMDSCWSVPVAMAAAAFLVCMPWSWFGLLFVFFMEKFDITREMASWPKSTASMLSHISGLAVYALQQCSKTYYIVLLSTILCSAAFVLSAFASNIFWMTMTFGVMHGLGHGIFVTSSCIYTLLHFEKYRAIATSLGFLSFGVSAIISQFALAYLVELYDLDGALLVYGGVLLNSTAIVMLAKNPRELRCSWKARKSQPLLKADLNPKRYEATTEHNATQQSPGEPQGLYLPEKKALLESCTVTQALALLCTPAFYVLLVTVVVGDYTYLEFSATIVDYGIDKGIALDSAKHLITFSAVGQLVGRLVVPLQADFAPFTRRLLYTLSFLTICSCMVALPYVSTPSTIFALATVTGVSQGYVICIKYVFLAEYLGVERTAAAIGIIGIFMTPVFLVSPTILGQFRDVSGSYDGYYQLMGAVSLVAAVLFATHDACSQRRTQRMHCLTNKSPASQAT
ncbi:monocarboxylate transporter 12-like [Dermacentor variabilis]|uniref:monocarboxylate transporter 12-like n=1 Tax=Dermacentor variabilis TaxID=34621 RepID=UPI003F5C4E8C